jgi:NAD(P)H-hydrate epimerase
VLSEPARLTPVPTHQADILGRMGVPIASRPPTADLIIDALIGYSLRGDPAGAAAELITWANGQAAPILALDTPSGVDLTTGAAGTPAVRAAATLTLALPKVGLLDAPNVGELYLADISVPPLVYQRMGIAVPELFRQSSLLRIETIAQTDEP